MNQCAVCNSVGLTLLYFPLTPHKTTFASTAKLRFGCVCEGVQPCAVDVQCVWQRRDLLTVLQPTRHGCHEGRVAVIRHMCLSFPPWSMAAVFVEEKSERERERSLGIAHILFDQFDLTVLKLRGRGRERGRERERASEREGEGEREREREGGRCSHSQSTIKLCASFPCTFSTHCVYQPVFVGVG